MRAQKKYPEQLNLSDFSDKSLLILDDDDPLRGRLTRAMEKKGFEVKEAKTVAEGLQVVKNNPPAFAVVDLRLEDGNGLDVVKELSKNRKDPRIVMLTGYGNLPTAVGRFPYPVNITILGSFLFLDSSLTTSSPFPSSSLRSTTAKAGGLFLTT